MTFWRNWVLDMMTKSPSSLLRWMVKVSTFSTVALIGWSLSIISISSPILNGMEKKMTMPAVILLRIDHWANMATPMIVKSKEKTMITFFNSTPHIMAKVITLARLIIIQTICTV